MLLMHFSENAGKIPTDNLMKPGFGNQDKIIKMPMSVFGNGTIRA